jgi:hypothetical protein
VAFPHQRRTRKFRFEKLPVPWLNTCHVLEKQAWTPFDDHALNALQEHDCMLCNVCGEQLGHTKILGYLWHCHAGPLTSGSPMHARCALLAYTYCPEFSRRDPDDVFYVYRGPGSGLVRDPSVEDLGEELTEILMDRRAKPITVSEVRVIARNETRPSGAGCPLASRACLPRDGA